MTHRYSSKFSDSVADLSHIFYINFGVKDLDSPDPLGSLILTGENCFNLYLAELFNLDGLTIAPQDELTFKDQSAKMIHFDSENNFLYCLNKHSPTKLYMVHLSITGDESQDPQSRPKKFDFLREVTLGLDLIDPKYFTAYHVLKENPDKCCIVFIIRDNKLVHYF
jgi:hypothetical protein